MRVRGLTSCLAHNERVSRPDPLISRPRVPSRWVSYTPKQLDYEALLSGRSEMETVTGVEPANAVTHWQMGLALLVVASRCCLSALTWYAMLCYAMLCYAMLCYAMLCYATPRASRAPR